MYRLAGGDFRAASPSDPRAFGEVPEVQAHAVTITVVQRNRLRPAGVFAEVTQRVDVGAHTAQESRMLGGFASAVRARAEHAGCRRDV